MATDMATDNTATISLPETLEACSKVHWMPFGIAFDGPASTAAQYFEPQQQQQTDGPSTSSCSGASHWEAYFRGRRLKGVTKALPDGFQGLLLKPAGNSASTSTSDTQQRSWQAIGGFSELVLWGHDAAPAATDPHMRCIDWLVLADKVHQPVTAEQVQAELNAMQDQDLAS